MPHSPSAPAIPAANATTVRSPAFTRWADLAIALMLAVLGLVCAGRSMAMMTEIPGDTLPAVSATGSLSSADSMAAQPQPRSP